MFNKSLESALGAMARLAEVYDDGQTTLTADQIAEDRQLNKPFMSKLLTALVQGGLVASKPGRRGGFSLSRPPGEIRLIDVAECVGHRTRIKCCSFGPGYGDEGQHCPMHDKVADIRDRIRVFLETSTLGEFARDAATRAKLTGG